MSSIGHMVEAVNTFCDMAWAHDTAQPGTCLFKVKSYFFVKSLEGSMEAEAFDSRLSEAEAEAK